MIPESVMFLSRGCVGVGGIFIILIPVLFFQLLLKTNFAAQFRFFALESETK